MQLNSPISDSKIDRLIDVVDLTSESKVSAQQTTGWLPVNAEPSETLVTPIVDFVDRVLVLKCDFDGAIKPYQQLPKRFTLSAYKHGKAASFICSNRGAGYRVHRANADLTVVVDEELDVG